MGSKQLFLDNLQLLLNILDDQKNLIPVEYFNFDNNDALNFKFKYKNNDTIYNVYVGLDYELDHYPFKILFITDKKVKYDKYLLFNKSKDPIDEILDTYLKEIQYIKQHELVKKSKLSKIITLKGYNLEVISLNQKSEIKTSKDELTIEIKELLNFKYIFVVNLILVSYGVRSAYLESTRNIEEFNDRINKIKKYRHFNNEILSKLSIIQTSRSDIFTNIFVNDSTLNRDDVKIYIDRNGNIKEKEIFIGKILGYYCPGEFINRSDRFVVDFYGNGKLLWVFVCNKHDKKYDEMALEQIKKGNFIFEMLNIPGKLSYKIYNEKEPQSSSFKARQESKKEKQESKITRNESKITRNESKINKSDLTSEIKQLFKSRREEIVINLILVVYNVRPAYLFTANEEIFKKYWDKANKVLNCIGILPKITYKIRRRSDRKIIHEG